MSISEIDDAVDALNGDDHTAITFPAVLTAALGSYQVTWLGQVLWDSEEDDREYISHNVRESLLSFLIRQRRSVFTDIQIELDMLEIMHRKKEEL